MYTKTALSFVCILFLMTGTVVAQKTISEKGDRSFTKKDYESALREYLSVFPANPEDPMLNYRIGLSYLYTERKSLAVPYLEKTVKIKPELDADIDYHLGMAYQNDHQYAKAREHFIAFKKKNLKLEDITNHKIAECEIGDSLTHHPAHVTIRNLGAEINTAFNEFSPLLTADGNTLVFTSNRSDDDYKIKSGMNFEDILISRRSGSAWSAPQKISDKINIKYNDAAAWLSADGKTLLLYYEENAGDIYYAKLEGNRWSDPVPLNKNINTPLFWETSACISADGRKLYFASNRPGGRGELDIYVSELDAKGNWGKAVNLGPSVNTAGNEDSPFIHADGVTLFFSSDGHPSMGSADIFKSEFKDGKWHRAVNMGFPINSIEYDGFFSLSPDRTTAIYSTLRHETGLGGSDIYEVTFLPDQPVVTEQTTIAAAEQPTLSERITKDSVVTANTVVTNEIPPAVTAPVPSPTTDSVAVPVTEPVVAVVPPALMPDSTVIQPVEVAAQGQPLPVDSVKITVATPAAVQELAGSQQDDNDPLLHLRKDEKVITVLRGKVIDQKTTKPLSAVISLTDNETNQVLEKIYSNRRTGEFELIIPHGGNYGVSTEKEGYLFNSINFSVPQFTEYRQIDTHIMLIKAEVGSKVVLKNIFFDTGKSELKPQSIAEVHNILELLIANPHLSLQINGHTDNTGQASANKVLSLRRATAVVDYIKTNGIDPERLTAKGFGSDHPLVSNDDEEGGREINRRTEIEIVGSSQ